MSTLAPYRIVYLPVGFAEAADRIADLVEAGRLAIQPHWTSREACQAFIDRQPRGLHAAYAPTVTIIRDAGDAERGALPPAIPVSMTDRRDGGCVSGCQIEEGGGANDHSRSGQRDVAPSSTDSSGREAA
jgi:hypothetical protein